ncbi:MAG: sigma-70 family RNA polymerase sigma factor [Candidatus Diapherotrites archaeon]|nr:sigma-70 family RNA polymerase sigma factor [Candidatus Diapherotrites archaeon]MDZ4256173.1 sigma-70 family RNA polymerase sigma factor [archaeon]
MPPPPSKRPRKGRVKQHKFVHRPPVLTMDYIIEHHIDLIHDPAKRWESSFAPFNIDREDLAQEALVALIKEAPKYDVNRGSSNTFVNHVVNSRFNKILRTLKEKKRHPGGKKVSFPLDLSSSRSSEGSHRALIKYWRRLYNKYSPILSPKEKKIMEMRMQGMNYREIGAVFNLTQNRIQQIVKLSIQRMRDRFLELE